MIRMNGGVTRCPKKTRGHIFCIAFFATALVIGAGAASSHERSEMGAKASSAFEAFSVPASSGHIASVAADPCLPLLRSASDTTGAARNSSQPMAGKLATLGYVLGLRYALAPAEHTPEVDGTPRRDDAGVRLADNPHALAVTGYRQCQKSAALKALQTVSR